MASGFSSQKPAESPPPRDGEGRTRGGGDGWRLVKRAHGKAKWTNEPSRARRLLLSGAGEQLRHVTALNGAAAAGHAYDILGIVTREEAAGYVTSGIQALDDVQLRIEHLAVLVNAQTVDRGEQRAAEPATVEGGLAAVSYTHLTLPTNSLV